MQFVWTQNTGKIQSDFQVFVGKCFDAVGIEHFLGGLHIVDAEDDIGFFRTGTGEGVHVFNVDVRLVQDHEDRPGAC